MPSRHLIAAITTLALTAGALAAQDPGGVGIRAGVGTDATLGVAFGVEINYTRVNGPNALELGLMGFLGQSSEDTQDAGACCSYHEETDVTVFAALANYLFGYDKPGPYFVAGVGVGAVTVNWREESFDDTSLGSPLPGGGSFQEEDGSAGGTIVNFGIGHRLSPQLDLRAQVPTFFIFDTPGEAASVIPTLTVTVGYRF